MSVLIPNPSNFVVTACACARQRKTENRTKISQTQVICERLAGAGRNRPFFEKLLESLMYVIRDVVVDWAFQSRGTTSSYIPTVVKHVTFVPETCDNQKTVLPTASYPTNGGFQNDPWGADNNHSRGKTHKQLQRNILLNIN